MISASGKGFSMTGRLGRMGVIASAVLLAVTGTVSAGASEPVGPRGDAVAVRATHDMLRDAAAAGDVEKVASALEELGPLLAELASGQRHALPSGSRELVDSAGEAAASAREQLAQQFPAGVARADVPPLPDLLNLLLQQLLEILAQLVDNLLGGGVPIPAPAANG